MPKTDDAGTAASEQASVWMKALQSDAAKAFDKALVEQADVGTPGEASAADAAVPEDKQTPETPAPAATTPKGTAEEKATQEDAPEGAVAGLDGIPEEYREVVAAALKTKEKQLQSGYTKKYQDLSQKSREVDALLEAQQALGLDTKSIADYAAAFKQLQETPGIRIVQGDRVLFEAKDAAQHDTPDFDSMTKAELAAHFQKEVERVKAQAAEEAKKQVTPLVEQSQMAAAQQKVQGWRSARKDIADDEIALAVALAQRFEQEVLPKGLDAVDSYMAPFVALARALKQQGSASPTPKPQARTELPKRETQAPKKSLSTLEEMAEEAARKAGHRSLNGFLKANQGD